MIELINKDLLNKFKIIDSILKKIDKMADCQNLILEFDEIENNFSINIASIYSNKNIEYNKKYENILCSILVKNISIKLNKLVKKIEIIMKNNNLIDFNNIFSIKKKKKNNINNLQYLFNIFPWDINIDNNYNQIINYNNCLLCNNNMSVDYNQSELKCDHCGMIKELICSTFDNIQFYNQEGQKIKSGTFNPNRHFHFWWTHILAKESEEELGNKKDPDNQYGEKIIKQIKSIIVRDHKILQLLTVNDIRSFLREIERTDLNKNVPLILKKLTGIGPPNISDEITIKVERLFTKTIEIGNRIKYDNRINRNYYPYYIYRIIEAITTEKDIELRRILFYIYIQSKETIELNDLDWEKICNELNEINYKPTDRILGYKYSFINNYY